MPGERGTPVEQLGLLVVGALHSAQARVTVATLLAPGFGYAPLDTVSFSGEWATVLGTRLRGIAHVHCTQIA